jgi:ABC-type uncharacterized transport system substrate-binding protein
MKLTLARLVAAFALVYLIVQGASEGQQVAKVYRIGWLHPITAGPRATFRDALSELGYVEGKTITFETRLAEGKAERLPELAADLVRSKVDIIVAIAPAPIRAAKQATNSIPIVMAYWGGPDLVESGIVASFARPGANVTGVHMLNTALDPKRFELLVQSVPKSKRVAVLTHGAHVFEPQLAEIRKLAQTIGVQLHVADVRDADDGYESAFRSIAQAGAVALLVPSSPRFVSVRKLIIELAAKRRIPAIYEWGFMAHEGGLMAYGPSQVEMDRRAAVFVDKIFKGAKPGDLPIEQPTKFELVVNLKTAKALDLTLPPSLLLRADQVIE